MGEVTIVYRYPYLFDRHVTADTFFDALNDWRVDSNSTTPECKCSCHLPQALPPLFVVDVEADE